MILAEVKQPSNEEIETITEKNGYQQADLDGKTEKQKEKIRNKNNNAFSKLLDHFGVDHERKKVRIILQDEEIPDYELGIVVKNRHANYHNSGFTAGMNGKDILDNVDIVKAFNYIIGK